MRRSWRFGWNETISRLCNCMRKPKPSSIGRDYAWIADRCGFAQLNRDFVPMMPSPATDIFCCTNPHLTSESDAFPWSVFCSSSTQYGCVLFHSKNANPGSSISEGVKIPGCAKLRFPLFSLPSQQYLLKYCSDCAVRFMPTLAEPRIRVALILRRVGSSIRRTVCYWLCPASPGFPAGGSWQGRQCVRCINCVMVTMFFAFYSKPRNGQNSTR